MQTDKVCKQFVASRCRGARWSDRLLCAFSGRAALPPPSRQWVPDWSTHCRHGFSHGRGSLCLPASRHGTVLMEGLCPLIRRRYDGRTGRSRCWGTSRRRARRRLHDRGPRLRGPSCHSRLLPLHPRRHRRHACSRRRGRTASRASGEATPQLWRRLSLRLRRWRRGSTSSRARMDTCYRPRRHSRARLGTCNGSWRHCLSSGSGTGIGTRRRH